MDLASDSEQRIATQFQPPPGKANLYIVCNDFGLFALFPVIVDAEHHGMLASGTYFVIPVEPGRHVVVSSTTEAQEGVEFQAEAGQNYFVSIKSRPGFQAMRMQVSLMPEAKGRQTVLEEPLAKKLVQPQR